MILMKTKSAGSWSDKWVLPLNYLSLERFLSVLAFDQSYPPKAQSDSFGHIQT